MTTDEILERLGHGTTLEGPFFTEPVRVLTSKARGTRIEVQAVGLLTKRLFNKDQLSDYSDVEFVGPGHPLFEAVVERVLREYGPALRQGAVFYNADATEPTILWLIKIGVEDGRGQTAGERLFAVHLSGGRYRKSQPYALLDLKAPESPRCSPMT